MVFDVDQRGLEATIARMSATTGQVEAARTSALRKMRKRLETRIKQKAARALRIPQRAIAGRFFSNGVTPGDDELRIWVGTWDVSPLSIGAPSVYGIPGISGGVRVGRRSYRGAFMGEIYSGTTKVWIRLHSPHYSPELYPTNTRPGDRGASELRGRFPVVRAAVPIDGVIRDIIEKDGEEMAQEFVTVFAQELNYQVTVKGATK